jgi:hypothetical protein
MKCNNYEIKDVKSVRHLHNKIVTNGNKKLETE